MGTDYGAVKKDYIAAGSGTKTVKEFECPPTPNDATFNGMIDLTLKSVDYINLTNPLLVNQVAGDNTIYPYDDNLNNAAACVNGTEANCEQLKINRHDFYLAGFQDGTFKEPVCIRHTVANLIQVYNSSVDYKCSIDTTKGSAVLGSAALVGGSYPGGDIIGFAAHPDGNQNCPSSVSTAVPAGYKWGKLWLMQAEYPARTVQYVTNANDIGQLYCTSRKSECFAGDDTNAATGLFHNSGNTATNSVCWSMLGSSPTGPSVGPQQSYPGYGNCSTSGTTGDTNNAPNAAFPYRAGNCIDSTNIAGIGLVPFNCCTDSGYVSNDTNQMLPAQQIDVMLPANYTSGGNYCNPSIIGANAGAAGGGTDNWLIGNGNKRACIEDDTKATGAINASTFPDTLTTFQMGTTFVDQNPVPDYVFVVTPTRVTVENMQNPTDPVGLQFTPKRTLPGGTLMVYRFNSQTGNVLGTGGVPQTRLAKYPMCVLQKQSP